MQLFNKVKLLILFVQKFLQVCKYTYNYKQKHFHLAFVIGLSAIKCSFKKEDGNSTNKIIIEEKFIQN